MLLPMTLTEQDITADFLETARCSIDNVKIKAAMPKDESIERLSRYHNPVLVMAVEKDCLFPAGNVLPRVEKVWKQSNTYVEFKENIAEDLPEFTLLSREQLTEIMKKLDDPSYEIDAGKWGISKD